MPSPRQRSAEREPLLASSQQLQQLQPPPPPPARYDAIATDDRLDPPRASLPRSPYLTLSLRMGFLVGFILLLLSMILLLLLLVNLFVRIPLLLPPHRSPAILPIWFSLSSILIVAPGLLVFELASRATRALHAAAFVANLASLIVVCAVAELRTTHAWLGITALSLSFLSLLWALLTSHVLAAVQIPYTIQPQGGLPIVAHISAQQVQGKWGRAFKVLFAVIGTAIVAAVMLLLTFNVSLDAADARFRPLGNLTRVTLTEFHVPPNATDPPISDPMRISFRLHLACQRAQDFYSPDSRSSSEEGSFPLKDKGNATHGSRPTALVMTERGVAGVIGAEWVREMVARSSLPHAVTALKNKKKTDKGGDDDGDNDDGHLSLSQVCFWDRIGQGHTDFVSRPFSIPVHTEALHEALVAAGQIDGKSKGLVDVDKKKGDAGKNATALGPLMLVSTGFGSLFAQDFAATYPHLVHSLLFVDAETPQSWYTNAVPLKSGLRAGYAADYHGYFGSLYSDLLPTLLEPLGLTRLIGLLHGRTVVDRILAPGYHGGAHHSDPAGGGWRIRGAGGGNTRLLTSSWYERLDANQGSDSPNFRHLTSRAHVKSWNATLAEKPVAVLSSFWKVHRDVDGWGAIQRDVVGKAKEGGSLVGWWRVGDRTRSKKGRGSSSSAGGDEGGAEGLCATELGRVFCQEALRKLLAAGDLANSSAVAASGW